MLVAKRRSSAVPLQHSAVEALSAHGRRWSAITQALVCPVFAVLALAVAPPEGRAITVGIVALTVAWSLAAGWLQLAGRSRGLLPADLLVIALICLSQPWTVRASAVTRPEDWTLAVASVSAITYQWRLRPASGLAAALTLALAYNVGCLLSGRWTPGCGAWLLVQAAMSRGFYQLLQSSGRQADAVQARGEDVSRAAAAAKRADLREHLAALHDTAAATLLMVANGMVTGHETWLPEQASRDIQALTGHTMATSSDSGLLDMLRRIEPPGIAVSWQVPEALRLPHPAALAVCGSVHEALTNVARHARVSEAQVMARSDAGRVLVTVRDRGVGFSPRLVPADRRGLSGSIRERMARVNGAAEVRSSPGHGTEISVEWPRRHGSDS